MNAEDLTKLCTSMLHCSAEVALQITDNFPKDIDVDRLSFLEIKALLVDTAKNNDIQF